MIWILSKLQARVSWHIDTMKSTWNKIANTAIMSSKLDDELSRENLDFYELEEDVSRFLEPFQNAQKFLSWTSIQMNTISNGSVTGYPYKDFDDLLLEEYLDGAVIILNLDLLIG